MPFYTYRAKKGLKGCPYCSESFEVRQSMDDARLQSCPQCGTAVEQIFSSCNFVRWPSRPLTDARLKRAGLHKLVKDDSGRYVDTTAK